MSKPKGRMESELKTSRDYGPSEVEIQQTENSDEWEPYIYTSIRYDPTFQDSPANTAASFNRPCPFYMLEHHWTRLQVANWTAQFWPQKLPAETQGKPGEFFHGLMSAVRRWQQLHPEAAESAEALRIRRRAFVSGRMSTEIWQIPRKPLSVFFPSSFDVSAEAAASTPWTVIVDCRPTEANEATMFKIWDRTPHGRARADAGILSLGTTKEVLLYGSDNVIIDGSNSTPYLHRNGRWVTPTSSCGGLQGTTRRWALENGLCFEAVISIDTLLEGEFIWFSNAVGGYFLAVYHTRDPGLKQPSAAECRNVLQQLKESGSTSGRD